MTSQNDTSNTTFQSNSFKIIVVFFYDVIAHNIFKHKIYMRESEYIYYYLTTKISRRIKEHNTLIYKRMIAMMILIFLARGLNYNFFF
jgi:hypothetical protein